MRAGRRKHPLGEDWEDSMNEAEELLASGELEEDSEELERRSAAMLNPRRIITLILAVGLLIVAVYVIFPKVVGVSTSIDSLGEATWYWVVAAVGFLGLAFLSYTALFRGVLGGRDPDDPARQRLDLRASWQITMSGFAATVLFSAAGAGGVALTYWALRQAGIPRRRAACRMVAFLALLYSVYLISLIVFGVLLRTGAVSGEAPVSVTIIPAAIAGGVLFVLLMVTLIPGDAERRVRDFGRFPRFTKIAGRLATVPATLASGIRTAVDHLRNPRLGPQAYLAAIGYWAGNIGILWASFHAFGVHVPLAVVVQGFFVGMVANLAPSPAAGVGTVDAGLIGSFVVFGLPSDAVFPAVLVFRLIGFWLPIPVGVVAYLRLLGTAHEWESEQPRDATIQNEVLVRDEVTGG
jgi:uncharacterized protein (TIRG00374 family)